MRGFATLLLLAFCSNANAACTDDGKFLAGAGHVELSFHDADYSLPRADICEWVSNAAGAVVRYYGRFPVAQVRIVLKPARGSGVSGGTTYGHTDSGAPLIVIQVGRKASRATLADDWVMTHELVHLSVPQVPDNSHWLEEGIATYVEPIARAQLGQLEAARVWRDMFNDMPKGTPDVGDQGLDRTPTWGRTYWGGAFFCLLADVEIRKQTGNKKGLQDALRGVLAAGGNIEQSWTVMRFMEAADQAVGVPAMSELYRRMKDAPGPGDKELAELWQQLGVSSESGQMKFKDDAPLAAIRRAIMAPPAGQAPPPGGEYRKNGGGYTSLAGTVISGDTLQVRQLRPADPGTGP